MRLLHFLPLGFAGLLACTTVITRKREEVDLTESNEEDPYLDTEKPDSIDDAGTFTVAARPAGADVTSSRMPNIADGGTVLNCVGDPAKGDLVVTEIMIASGASPDDGEWVEIMNTRSCNFDLSGVRIESPRGTAAADTVTITEKLVLPPFGTIVVADTIDPARNNRLPGKVLEWKAKDTLRNSNDTVKITSAKGVVLDEFTYDSVKLAAGTSLAFPDTCPLSARVAGTQSQWITKWSTSFATYGGSFRGSPNLPNVDVACP